MDPHNLSGDDNTVYFSIYNKDTNTNYTNSLKVTKETRKENKEEEIEKIIDKFYKILTKED